MTDGFGLTELRARRTSGNEREVSAWICASVVPSQDVAADIWVASGIVVQSGALVAPLLEHAGGTFSATEKVKCSRLTLFLVSQCSDEHGFPWQVALVL